MRLWGNNNNFHTQNPMPINNAETRDSQAMSTWLNDFVLLNPYNPEAKRVYFALLPKVVADSLADATSTDKCKELLYRFSMNSQLSSDERLLVNNLMNKLNEMSPTKQADDWPPKARTPPPATCQWPANNNNNQETWSRARRSLSLTATNQPLGTTNHCLGTPNQSMVSGNQNLEWSPTSGSPAHDDVFSHMNTFKCHGELSPQHSVSGGSAGSTSSGEHSDCGLPMVKSKNTFVEAGSGMKDVPIWLKSLRLHKYSPLFSRMTYDEMMLLTEERLEAQGVTKGARHKIVLSIQKLKERTQLLRQLEKDLLDCGSLKTTLNELKMIMATPIRPYSSSSINDQDQLDVPAHQLEDDNVPALIARVLMLCCNRLLAGGDDECFSIAVHLLDRCSNHEAFVLHQKKACQNLKAHLRRVWNQPNFPRKLAPRSNSWNKDRRPSGLASPAIVGRPVVSTQCSPTTGISGNATNLNFNSNCFVPFQHQMIHQQQQRFVEDMPPTDVRSHNAVQRAISAPTFHSNLTGTTRLPVGPISSSSTSKNAPQQQNYLMWCNNGNVCNGFDEIFLKNSINGHCNNVNGHSINGHSINGHSINGQSVNDHSMNSINGHSVVNSANGHHRQRTTPPSNNGVPSYPFQHRSAWSCGFEENAAANGGLTSRCGVDAASVVGAARPLQNVRQMYQHCNVVGAQLTQATPLNNYALNDINMWNLDQLCRRVMEAAIENDKSEISGI